MIKRAKFQMRTIVVVGLLTACPLAAIAIACAFQVNHTAEMTVVFLMFAHLAISCWTAMNVSWFTNDSRVATHIAVWIGIGLWLLVALLIFGFASLLTNGDGP
jgi:hypothetical protein